MSMRKIVQDVYKTLTSSEDLLRLLNYLPINALDNPLDSAKPNILDKPTEEKWEIIENCIQFTPTTSDLTLEPSCKLFVYPDTRNPTSNYHYANQRVVVDFFTHKEFNDKDARLSWISDTVNDLLSDEYVSNGFKVRMTGGGSLGSPVERYLGYQLVYDFDIKSV